MKNIIIAMIEHADRNTDDILIEEVKRLIDTLAFTYNAPSTWRDIGEELAQEYKKNNWLYENLQLWNHEEA